MRSGAGWWRRAAIYQIYLRSFCDGNGDGVGDLLGARARLPYVADLGADAIWFNPWYRSPMQDGGYDVADYRSIDPLFGSLEEAEKLIVEAHELGLRVIIDIVPNHGSVEHPWFREALLAGPGSTARERFHFRAGRGPSGDMPPNNWQSFFGGPAWSRTTSPEGRRGEWYLHLFAPGQPDLNWANPEVRAEFDSILRFWLDRGADGFRVDSATMLTKDPALPDYEAGTRPGEGHPYVDRDDVHDVYRRWRAVLDTYPDERVLVGEVWLADADRLARYLRAEEMHSAFNFHFLRCPFDAARFHQVIDATLASHAKVGAAPTWVLSNHDVVRVVTRFGREDTVGVDPGADDGGPFDPALGTRRARAAALLSTSLPGAVYVYQGEELGLPEVLDLPREAIQDPIWERSGHRWRGRDGCRVPLPWSGDHPPFGFTKGPARPWLPQPSDWARLAAARQEDDPSSMLSLYRRALRGRRNEPALQSEELEWVDSPEGVLAFRRGRDIVVVVNCTDHPVDLPPHKASVLTSEPLLGGRLGPDAAAWLRT